MVDDKPLRTVEEKLNAIRRAAQHEFPVSDIETMLAEIERGRSETTATASTEVSKIGIEIKPSPDR